MPLFDQDIRGTQAYGKIQESTGSFVLEGG